MGLHKLPILKLILQNVGDDGNGYIYLRAKIPGKKTGSPYVLKSLNHKVPSANWDAENEIVKRGYSQANRINNLIQSDKKKLQETFDRDYEKGTLFTEAHIRLRMYPPTGTGDFMAFFADYLALIKAQWSENYHRSFERAYTNFKGFAGESLPFHAVDVTLLENYQKSLKLARNTIYLRMRHLKEVIEKAISKELINQKQIDGYKFPTYKTPHKPYLTLEQTEKIAENIYNGRFANGTILQTVACYFLVECYSGVRVGDWHNFTIEKLIEERNFKVRANKNGEPVYLPLNVFKRLGKVVDFIIDNDIKFTHAQQTTNRLLKDIMLICDIDVHVTTHTGRRSAATMLAGMRYTTAEIAEVLGITEETAKTYVKSIRQGLNLAFERLGGL